MRARPRSWQIKALQQLLDHEKTLRREMYEQQRLRLGLAERPPTLSDDVELFVEVRPRWPIGERDSRSTTQQQQLSKRKQGHPAGDGAAKRAK